MRTILLAALLLIAPTVALANPHFYNASLTKYTIEATLPNGEKVTAEIGTPANTLGSTQLNLPSALKQVAGVIRDDLGAELWRGNLKNDQVYLISGGRLLFAGYYGSNEEPRAAVFATTEPNPIRVDLVGDYGLDVQRGLVFGPDFDVKKAVRFHAKEGDYHVKVLGPEGTSQRAEGPAHYGRYCLVWKDSVGNWQTTYLGTIKP